MSPPAPPEASFTQRLTRLPDNVRGALWVLASALLFSGMGTMVKFLAGSFESFQIAFFRALFGLLAITPFVYHMGFHQLKTRRLPLHIARGAIGSMGMLCGFYALSHLNYADAIAATYARTLFVIPLAMIFLGEVVRKRRGMATIVGFVGVLIMLRPGGDVEFAMLIALLGAFFVAMVMIIIKKLTQTERPETMLFYFGIITTLVALGPALMVWRDPAPGELALLILTGCFGAAGQYCMVRGVRVGEATAILPFDYSRLLFAALIGLALFGEALNIWTIAGAAIIVASTLYIGLREARLAKQSSGA